MGAVWVRTSGWLFSWVSLVSSEEWMAAEESLHEVEKFVRDDGGAVRMNFSERVWAAGDLSCEKDR